MSIIDIVLLLILIFFIIKGLIRGIILEAMTLMGLLVALIMALNGMEKAALFIGRLITLPMYLLSGLGFMCIFLIVFIVFKLAAVFFKKLIRKTPAVLLDRIGGMLSGLIKGVLAVCLAAHLFSWIPVRKAEYIREKEESVLLEPSMAIAPFLLDLLDWMPAARKQFNQFQDQINHAAQSPGIDAAQDTGSQSHEKHDKK